MFFVCGLFLITVVGLGLFSPDRQLEKPILDGRPITYWLQHMSSSGADRDGIRTRLVALGPSVSAPLLAVLDYKPSSIRLKASRNVQRWSPAVANWLRPKEHMPRWMAAYTLGKVPPNPRIREALLRVLREMENAQADSNLGFYAVEALKYQYTNDASIVMPALRRALKVPHGNIQGSIVHGLPLFGSYAHPAIPEIIPLLQSKDRHVCAHTATALGKFGVMASNALPALSRLLTNSEPAVRRSAAVARWKIAPETGFPNDILLWNMVHAGPEERWMAARALWTLDRTRSEEAAQILLALVESTPTDTLQGKPFHGFRWSAAETLGLMGGDAATALPALREIAKSDEDATLKQKAREACERIEKAIAAQRAAQEGP